MKRWQWVSLCVVLFLAVGMLGTTSVLANTVNEFDWNPLLTYNPIEGLRLGLGVEFNTLLGADELHLNVENALFTTRGFNSFLYYSYSFDNNEFYLNAADDLAYQGVFEEQGYYQRDQFISLGVTRHVFEPDYYYSADLMVKLLRMKPAHQPAEFQFDEGVDLAIYPSFFGTFKGYLGKLDLTFGLPSEYSDYNYIKANLLLKKAFDLSFKDRLVISTEAGYLRGNYPSQQQFFLGSSEDNVLPNFMDKVIGRLGFSSTEVIKGPAIALDGFQDHVFYGDKMYVAKIEYQRELISPKVTSTGNRVMGKIYTVFGDAWSGAVAEGFEDPKTAVGVGLHWDYPTIYPDTYMSLNLTHGIGEDSEFTVGVEMGSTVQLSRLITQNK